VTILPALVEKGREESGKGRKKGKVNSDEHSSDKIPTTSARAISI
jgi:hypothetical protein